MPDSAQTFLPRYGLHDWYVTEELRGSYLQANRDGRLQLLSETYATKALPFELARLVLDDADPAIRRWMAKNAYELDYREPIYRQAEEQRKETEYKHPDRDLWEELRNDPDPWVRAALHENPQFPPYDGSLFIEVYFAQLPHEHRLALIRNPRLASFAVNEIVLTVFDTSKNPFAMDDDQRTELALAFLSNKTAMEASREEPTTASVFDPSDLYHYEQKRERLWQLLAAFPSYEVRWHGFRYLGGKDEWKAAAYKQCEDSNLRYALLLNASTYDRETLKLGTEDEDKRCENLADEKFSTPDKPNRFWQVIGHVWTGLVDAVVLLIVLALFSRVDTTFERLVVALLVYIHLNVTGSLASLGLSYQAAMVALDAEFRKV